MSVKLLTEKDLAKIKAFVLDVDGVLTDGGLLCDLRGELFRVFDAKDGFGIRMAVMNGYPVGVITGGRSGSIRARFTTNAVPSEDVYLGARNKTEDFEDFCHRHGLGHEEVAFIGDDIPDIPPMRLSGLAACPCDAVEDVQKIANFISSHPGGRGCVREVIEMVMKAGGRWNFDVSLYKKLY